MTDHAWSFSLSEPRKSWRLRISPDASLAEVIAALNALDIRFHGTDRELAEKPEAFRRWLQPT